MVVVVIVANIIGIGFPRQVVRPLFFTAASQLADRGVRGAVQLPRVLQAGCQASKDQASKRIETTRHQQLQHQHSTLPSRCYTRKTRGQATRPHVTMSLFSFSTPLDIDIVLADTDDRPSVDVKLDKNRREKAPLYLDGETVKGAVTIRPKDGKRLEHTGIKVQFVGTIEMFFDRNTHHEFMGLQTELAAPGELQHPVTLPFAFKNVEKMYESYNGINVKLRYFLRVTVSRRMADVVREKDLWVYSYRQPPESNSVIKMDVGIEDCLHIEFEYSKSKYHLKDVIVGRIYFLLVRLKIKHMELSIIRRETTGVPPNQYNESETLVRFEIMDGSPSRGETIPIRLFLGGFDLTPTFRDVNKKYSTRYYLSLVLIDEDARRYFKQSEIVLYRQAPENSELAQRQAKEIQAS